MLASDDDFQKALQDFVERKELEELQNELREFLENYPRSLINAIDVETVQVSRPSSVGCGSRGKKKKSHHKHSTHKRRHTKRRRRNNKRKMKEIESASPSQVSRSRSVGCGSFDATDDTDDADEEANCNESSCGSSDATDEVEIELNDADDSDDADAACVQDPTSSASEVRQKFIFVGKCPEGSALFEMFATEEYYNLLFPP